jgi:signal peptidase I
MSTKKKENSFEPFRTIIIAGALALCFRSFLFEPFNIPSGSMIPTLKVGDYLFVSKFSYGYSRYSFPLGIIPFDGRVFGGEPDRGDVVVFRQPGNEKVDFIKRVVGLPGDEIAVRGGILHINDRPVPRQHAETGTATDGVRVMKYDDYVETLPEGSMHRIREMTDGGILDNTRNYVVPDGHFFMMGDNRDNSSDSRVWGQVPERDIVGKAVAIWMHWEEFFSVPSFGRAGAID